MAYATTSGDLSQLISHKSSRQEAHMESKPHCRRTSMLLLTVPSNGAVAKPGACPHSKCTDYPNHPSRTLPTQNCKNLPYLRFSHMPNRPHNSTTVNIHPSLTTTNKHTALYTTGHTHQHTPSRPVASGQQGQQPRHVLLAQHRCCAACIIVSCNISTSSPYTIFGS